MVLVPAALPMAGTRTAAAMSLTEARTAVGFTGLRYMLFTTSPGGELAGTSALTGPVEQEQP